VDVGNVANISEVHAASIFRVKVLCYKNGLLIYWYINEKYIGTNAWDNVSG
jgi:hypothetical protein